MKKLETLNILGLSYKVIYKKNKTDVDGEESIGLHQPYPKEIHLWVELEKDEMFQTLIHEAIHPIDFKLELNLNERKVKLLSVALADFFIRNGFIKP